MTVCTVVRTVCTAVSMFSSEARLSCVRSYVRCEAMLQGEAAYGARRCCKATLRAVRGDAAGRSCVRCEHARELYPSKLESQTLQAQNKLSRRGHREVRVCRARTKRWHTPIVQSRNATEDNQTSGRMKHV